MTADGSNASQASVVLKPEKDYYGVRGWLLVLCLIMVLVGPALHGRIVLGDIQIFFALGAEATYGPEVAANLRYAVGIEILLVACLALLSLAAGLALFMKKWFAPRLAKVFWASGPVFNAALFLSVWCFSLQGRCSTMRPWR